MRHLFYFILLMLLMLSNSMQAAKTTEFNKHFQQALDSYLDEKKEEKTNDKKKDLTNKLIAALNTQDKTNLNMTLKDYLFLQKLTPVGSIKLFSAVLSSAPLTGTFWAEDHALSPLAFLIDGTATVNEKIQNLQINLNQVTEDKIPSLIESVITDYFNDNAIDQDLFFYLDQLDQNDQETFIDCFNVSFLSDLQQKIRTSFTAYQEQKKEDIKNLPAKFDQAVEKFMSETKLTDPDAPKDVKGFKEKFAAKIKGQPLENQLYLYLFFHKLTPDGEKRLVIDLYSKLKETKNIYLFTISNSRQSLALTPKDFEKLFVEYYNSKTIDEKLVTKIVQQSSDLKGAFARLRLPSFNQALKKAIAKQININNRANFIKLPELQRLYIGILEALKQLDGEEKFIENVLINNEDRTIYEKILEESGADIKKKLDEETQLKCVKSNIYLSHLTDQGLVRLLSDMLSQWRKNKSKKLTIEAYSILYYLRLTGSEQAPKLLVYAYNNQSLPKEILEYLYWKMPLEDRINFFEKIDDDTSLQKSPLLLKIFKTAFDTYFNAYETSLDKVINQKWPSNNDWIKQRLIYKLKIGLKNAASYGFVDQLAKDIEKIVEKCGVQYENNEVYIKKRSLAEIKELYETLEQTLNKYFYMSELNEAGIIRLVEEILAWPKPKDSWYTFHRLVELPNFSTLEKDFAKQLISSYYNNNSFYLSTLKKIVSLSPFSQELLYWTFSLLVPHITQNIKKALAEHDLVASFIFDQKIVFSYPLLPTLENPDHENNSLKYPNSGALFINNFPLPLGFWSLPKDYSQEKHLEKATEAFSTKLTDFKKQLAQKLKIDDKNDKLLEKTLNDNFFWNKMLHQTTNNLLDDIMSCSTTLTEWQTAKNKGDQKLLESFLIFHYNGDSKNQAQSSIIDEKIRKHFYEAEKPGSIQKKPPHNFIDLCKHFLDQHFFTSPTAEEQKKIDEFKPSAAPEEKEPVVIDAKQEAEEKTPMNIGLKELQKKLVLLKNNVFALAQKVTQTSMGLQELRTKLESLKEPLAKAKI